MPKIFILSFVIFSTSNSFAQKYGFSGRVDSNHYVSKSTLSEVTSSLVEIQLTGKYLFTDKDKLTSNLDLKHGLTDISNRKNTLDSTFKELYWMRNTSNWSIKSGKFIQRWGKTDVLSPLDVLAARDQRYFYVEEERQYSAPQFSILLAKNISFSQKYCVKYKKIKKKFRSKKNKKKYKYRIIKRCVEKRYRTIPGPFNYQVVVNYSPQYNQFGLPVDLGPVTITEEPSSDEKNQIEWAGKINYTNSKLDLGLAFFMGRQRSPYILSDTPSSLSAVHFSYPKITMLGLEFERPFSNWVFRMDSALISGENTDQFNLNSINPYVETSFALESKINTSFRAIVYPILKNFINFKTQEEVSTSSDYNAIEKQLYLFNRIINGYQYKDQNSMGLRLSYESESLSHTASIFYLKNFTTEESYLQWDYKYVLNDSLELGVGVLNYEGSDQTRFGLLAEKSSYFSKITYWF